MYWSKYRPIESAFKKRKKNSTILVETEPNNYEKIKKIIFKKFICKTLDNHIGGPLGFADVSVLTFKFDQGQINVLIIYFCIVNC